MESWRPQMWPPLSEPRLEDGPTKWFDGFYYCISGPAHTGRWDGRYAIHSVRRHCVHVSGRRTGTEVIRIAAGKIKHSQLAGAMPNYSRLPSSNLEKIPATSWARQDPVVVKEAITLAGPRPPVWLRARHHPQPEASSAPCSSARCRLICIAPWPAHAARAGRSCPSDWPESIPSSWQLPLPQRDAAAQPSMPRERDR